MRNAKFWSCCGACRSTPSRFVLPGTARRYERSCPFRVEHLALELELDIPQRRVEGIASLTLTRQSPTEDRLKLDAVGFELERLCWVHEDADVPVDFSYDGHVISVAVPRASESAQLEIHYSVTPRKGMYFLQPDAEVPNRPEQVWTQCQDEDARYFFPCIDAPSVKMTSELRVTVPADWTVLSNGNCVEAGLVSDDPTRKLFHFQLARPHPSYLVTLVAGRFSLLEDRAAVLADGRSIPVRYYVPAGREAEAWASLGKTPQMVESFSQRLGVPFPYDSYSQIVVSDFVFGGMENTTATTLYEYALLDERAQLDVSMDDLVAHELAHQWFGDLVTCRDWSHAWLNEGFATFFEHVERERQLGRDEYDWGVLADLASYLEEAKGRYDRPIVCRDYQNPIDLFDRHLYEKGGLVLHMLRRELGDELFFGGVGDYLRSHSDGVAETLELQRALETRSGRSLERFFDEWVHRAGHPELTVSASYEDERLTVTLKQTQTGASETPFSLPFELELVTHEGVTLRVRKNVTEAVAVHVISLPKRPRSLAFDPDFRVTAPHKLEFGADWLTALATEGRSLRCRVAAVQALGKRDEHASQAALGRILADAEAPWMLRVECARALGSLPSPDALKLLLGQTSAPHPKVRRAVAAALGAFRRPEVVAALTPLAEQDPSWLVQADAARALGRSRQPGAQAVLLSLLDRESWADVVRAGALDGLAALRQPELLSTLREYTRYGLPTRGRRSAIAALGHFSDDRQSRERLEELLDDADPHLRIDVVDALVEQGQAAALAPLTRREAREPDDRVVRRLREARRSLESAGQAALGRVTDELEELKRRLRELELGVARVAPAQMLTPKADTGSTARRSKSAKADDKTAKKRKKADKADKARKSGRRA